MHAQYAMDIDNAIEVAVTHGKDNAIVVAAAIGKEPVKRTSKHRAMSSSHTYNSQVKVRQWLSLAGRARYVIYEYES